MIIAEQREIERSRTCGNTINGFRPSLRSGIEHWEC